MVYMIWDYAWFQHSCDNNHSLTRTFGKHKDKYCSIFVTKNCDLNVKIMLCSFYCVTGSRYSLPFGKFVYIHDIILLLWQLLRFNICCRVLENFYFCYTRQWHKNVAQLFRAIFSREASYRHFNNHADFIIMYRPTGFNCVQLLHHKCCSSFVCRPTVIIRV